MHSLIKGVKGDGKCICFWIDKWFGDIPLMFKWPRVFALEKCKDCNVADRFSGQGVEFNLSWRWSRSPSSPDELAEMVDAGEALSGVSLSSVRDRWRWDPDDSGVFSTKSFKLLMTEGSNEEVIFSFKDCGWVPYKCKIFIWRAVLDKIPTRQALLRRNIAIESDVCILCGEASESVDHLFSGCSITTAVWNRFVEWAKLPPFFAFSFLDIMDLHKGTVGNQKAKELVRGLVMVICWTIWKYRNDKIFDNGSGESENIFKEARALGYFWFKCRSKFRNLVWSDWCNHPMYML
ncbi:putative reverse transcriptase zinc-binding domain-containing protein [Helianthus annuus]|nr:putative reverse transcriptase zinc-binding domain-containing protein [Helianthus annuus]KAJ0541239.1 putative reverse transcriptase zinc-binding domain-containing protein [Helianthus annuus]KAJ0706321.1 putative reverse transcriptase zinc-binding domain-containing protein [Helianthus annuus]KAJ0710371.1 putative reverse transcriptase zinc-binding domain-containing protein [Helianthus annuus]KAJ0886832.1 putative reverse transcriptase zinc-binding domain-containing protein [Helianthus annuus